MRLNVPIFVASPRYRRELGAAIGGSGRTCDVSATMIDIDRTFRNTESLIAIVDARGALELGLDLLAALARPVADRRGALLVLLSRRDSRALGEAYDAGATHYLIAPFGAEQLDTALRFVERGIRRMQESGADAAVAGAQAMLTQSARWRWRVGESELEISGDLTDVLGLPPSQQTMSLREALSVVPFDERHDVLAGLRRLGRAEIGGTVEHSREIDGLVRHIVHHIRPLKTEDGVFDGLAATVEDLAATVRQRRLSLHLDPLTGLASATFARARLDDILREDDRGQEPAAIAVLIAISRLDQVNAAHGRKITDQLLQAVARRLARLLAERKVDRALTARLGGAEFAVIFEAPVLLNEATHVAAEVGRLFAKPFVIGGRVIHLACRIGIAASDQGTQSSEDLLHRASSALATAKQNDPNSFQVYVAGREDDPARLADLSDTIRKAANEAQLDIRYQPQVDIAANRITGVEALVRFDHPTLGTIPAETLLATAERGEFSVELGRNIVRQACRDACNWPGLLGRIRLSVNVTATDIRDQDFVAELMKILKKTKFPPDRLTLEITEGGLVEDLERTSHLLAGLRARDIRVAIDDFGTGYSSLAYLKSLPLDYLKIDKRIAADIEGGARDKVIVRGVVDMARTLGMTVIAEGVESEAQLELLVREGCNWYQGYLCAPALPPEELESFVRNWETQQGRVAVHA